MILQLWRLLSVIPNSREKAWEEIELFIWKIQMITIKLKMTRLNCINWMWNRTNSEILFTTFGRSLLRFTMSPMVFKLCLMSSASGNSIEQVPNKNIMTHLTITIIPVRSTYWIKEAVKKPTGFLVSNGSLRTIYKWKSKKSWTKLEFIILCSH